MIIGYEKGIPAGGFRSLERVITIGLLDNLLRLSNFMTLKLYCRAKKCSNLQDMMRHSYVGTD